MNLFTQSKPIPETVFEAENQFLNFKTSHGWKKGLTKIFALVFLVIMASLLTTSFSALTAQSSTCVPGSVNNGNTDDWSEECYLNNLCQEQGNPCQAGDVTLTGIFLADSMGNPLPPCHLDTMETVTLWGFFSANATRYAVRARTELWINGVYAQELIQCAFDLLPNGVDSFALLGSFTYQCGDQIQLLNTWVAWNTNASQCSDPMGADYVFDCGDYSPSKCSKNLEFVDLLSADFVFSCAGQTGSTTQFCFTDLTTGANGPLSWNWDFGDGNMSTLQNPCHTYNGTSGIFTVTLTVTDSVGNISEAFTEVDLGDTSCCVLVLSCPPMNGGIFSCATQIPAADPDLVVIVDSCGPTSITVQNSTTGSGCGTDTLYHTRHYIVTDGTNTDTCTQIFRVRDSVVPVITCPANVTVQCNTSTAPAATGGSATATDNCDVSVAISFTDATVAGGCPQEFTITRTWLSTDDCGNTATCNQIITVDDSAAPSITCPPSITIECTASTAPGGANGSATATDICDTTPTISSSDVTTSGGCAQEYTITRTWLAADDCGNTATCVQTIVINDSAGPTITCPPGITIECDESTEPANTGVATATDLCGGISAITFSDVAVAGACNEEFVITRTWIAIDACGNSSTCNQIINVEDTVPPMITCPANTTIECSESSAPGNTGSATATDICDPSISVTFADVTTAGSCAQSYTITRTWTAADGCGNSTTCSQTIFVEDTTDPMISSLPAPGSVECPLIPSFTTPTATDLCDPAPSLTFADVTTSGACPQEYSVTRTWTAIDDCGNSSTASQVISVTDNTPPSIMGSFGPVGGECPVTPSFTSATATDLCDPAPSLTFADVTTSGVCPQEYSVTRTWTAVDACGNSSSQSQTFTVTDNTPPTIICPDPAPTVECPGVPDFGVATATDACDGMVVITFDDVTIAGDCPAEYTVTRTWTAVDDCGNAATCSRTISVVDTTNPVITCPDPVASVECPAMAPPFGAATATDACDPDVSITFADVTTAGPCATEFTITRTWTAVDDCGNTATCSRSISVTDNTPPTILCPNPPPTVECPAVPVFGDATATDACDGMVTVTFDDVTIAGTCDQEYTITRTWTALDDCGNSATCSRTISVTDNTPPVLTCPTTPVSVECPAVPSFGAATATDACDPSVIPTFADVTVAGACPQEYSVTRTWTAIDDCGNSATCSRTISVTDNTPPAITCPPNITIECDESTATANTGTATATDLCDPGAVIISNDYIGTPPASGDGMQWVFMPPGTSSGTCTSNTDCETNTICFALQYTPGVTGTLTSYTTGFFVDCYNGGNPISYNQSCVMTDNSAETEDCGGSGLVLMNSSGNTGTLGVTQNVPVILHQVCFVLGVGGSVVIDEDESTDLTTSIDLPGGGEMTETPTFTNYSVDFDTFCPEGCIYPYVIYREFRALDDCGNVGICVQTITLEDTTAPVLTCPDPTPTVECPGVPSFGDATATDNCDPAPIVTFEDLTIVSTVCSQEYSVTRTWTAVDVCGNSATCSRTVNVTDNTPPVITCPDPPATVECPALPVFGDATATDACDASVIPTFVDVTVAGPCPQEYTVTRTWTATDDCGNTATCSRTISVTDNTPPTITCPNPPATVECPGVQMFGDATATDACDASVTPTFVDVTVAGACPQEYTVTRTWTATDDCGNSATCSRTISVTDNTPPTITCPDPPVTVECPAVPVFGDATATDACDASVIPTFVDVTVAGPCPQEYTVTRTWTATDDCGNSATCSRTISVTDNTPPTITCPNPPATVECPALPVFGDATATDACDASVIPTFVDVTLAGPCPQEYTVTRTWTATDDCGNSATCSRTISVTDNTPPTITCPNPPATVECPAVPVFGDATATDACDASVIPTFADVTVAGACPQEYTVTRTWTATDDCGNSATCSRTISVVDTTPPDFTCPPTDTIDCLIIQSPPFTSYTQFILEGGAASDDCGLDTLTFGLLSEVSDGETCPETVTRTYTISDFCGNSATCTHIVFINDTIPPVMNCPPAISVSCDISQAPPYATIQQWAQAGGNGVENCFINNSSFALLSEVSDGNTCPEIVTRTYVVADLCGNTATCAQNVVINDELPPLLSCPPADTVACLISQIPPFASYSQFISEGGAASDNCGLDTLTFGLLSEVSDGETCPETVTRTYTISDFCGNSATCTHIILINDTIPPVMNCPPAITVDCDISQAPPYATIQQWAQAGGNGVENCFINNSSFALLSEVSDGNTCPEIVTRTYVVSDLCGNTATCNQLIIIDDITPPTITCPNPPATVECPSVPVFGDATATDACDASVIPTFVDVTVAGACPQEYMVTRTWTATDDCGNSATCSRTISVTDNTPPTITCPNPPATVECPAVPVFGDATATDACDASVIPIFVDVTVAGPCPQEYTVTRTWTATDDCGNSATCSRTISVTDNTPPNITPLPPPGSVECPDVPVFTTPMVSDACDPVVIPTFMDVTTAGVCDQEYSITRTWTATDDCGNSSTASQTINILDNTPPTIVCPTDLTLECAFEVPAPNIMSVTATDNCDGAPVITFAGDVTIFDECADRFTVARTYRATDDCGNSATCIQLINVYDDTPPSITCPPSFSVDCEEDIPDPDPSLVVASDNCLGMVTVIHVEDLIEDPLCTNQYALSRRYRATDACGNTADCLQFIYVFDDIPPTITCPDDITLECAYEVPAPDITTVIATDNCNQIPTIVHVSDVTINDECVNRFQVVRTYSATDDCGNSATCAQIITVYDDTAPTIICPGDITVDCAEDVPQPSPAVVLAGDNCQGIVTVSHVSDVIPSVSFECTNRYVLIRTYRATDDCGNSATCSHVITVYDDIAPTLTCPGDVTLECTESTDIQVNGIATATDNCDNPVLVTSSDVTIAGECAQEYRIDRTWTATDICGNSASCLQVLWIQDTTPPTIICPADVTLDCNDSTDPYVMTFDDEGEYLGVTGMINMESFEGFAAPIFDNVIVTTDFTLVMLPDLASCGIYNFPIEGSHATDGVNYVLDQSDAGGTATFTFNAPINTFGLNLTDWGDFGTGMLTFSDNAGDLFTVSVSPNVNGNEQFFGVINSLMDFTMVTFTQTIDGEAFGIDEVYYGNIEYNPGPEVSDNCDPTPLVDYSDVIFEGACAAEYTIERTWTATDDCGNSSSCVQVLTIVDETAPIIVCPQDLTLECDQPTLPNATGVAEAGDLCDPEVTVSSSDVVLEGTCAYTYIIVRTWTATDDCGNSSTCVQTIDVRDTTAPDITCPPNITIECDDSTDPSIMVITDEELFLDMLGPLSLESFENNPTGFTNTIVTVPFTLELDPPFAINGVYNFPLGGAHATDGVKYVYNQTDAGGTATFTFANEINCFGLNITDWGDFMNGALTFSNDAGDNFTIAVTFLPDANEQFFGVKNASMNFSTVVLTQSSNGDNYGIDEVYYGLITATGGPEVTDNCDPDPVKDYSDVIIPGVCDQAYTIERTWTATDDCGNSSTCLQIITVVDVTAPLVVCPEDITVSCADDVPAVDPTSVSVTDNCDPAPVVTHVADVTVNQTCVNRYTLQRTYQATDDCGNTTTCMQVITVFDEIAPVILCPMNVTIQCNTSTLPDATGMATALDNCEGEVVLPEVWINEIHYDNTGTDTGEFIEVAGPAGTDLSVYSIVLYNGAGGATYDTDALSGMIDNESNGFGAVSLAYPSNGIQNGSPDGMALVKNGTTVIQFLSYEGTFTATNGPANGMMSTSIGVSESGAEAAGMSLRLTGTGNAYGDFIWNAPSAASAGSLNPGQTITALGSSDIDYADVTIAGACPQEYTIQRTWSATDECGNSSTCLQTIEIVDTTAPTLSCAPNTTIECDESTLPANTGSSTATDNCDTDVIPVYADAITPGNCPQEYTISRTWTATDDCGNSATCLQVITVDDSVAPDLTCAADIVIQCDESTLPDNTGSSTATDNCDLEVIPVFADVTVAGACPQEYMISRTWTATDDCGNSSTCLQTITVEDTTPPDLTCAADIIIECDESTLPDITGASTATDNCDLEVIPVFADITAAGACPQEYTISRTWTATDDCGNSSTCLQIITVDDSTPPDLTCAIDVTIECDESTLPDNTGTSSATDNCDPDVVPVYADVTTQGVCPQEYTIFRTWTATDDCGNSSTCLQTITVDDSVAPDLTCAADVTIECDESTLPDNTASSTATDNCDLEVIPVYADVTVAGTCPQEYTIERTWTATDDCGNSSTCLQLITVEDITPPDLVCAMDVTIECDESTLPDNTGASTATDNCDLDVVPVFADVTVAGSCPQEYTIERTWTATDDCGNSSTCLQTIIVEDITPPDLTCAPDVTIECDESTLPIMTGASTATDNCDMEVIPVFSDITTAGACPQEYTISRTWTATDDCGNSSTCLQTITVDDSTPPDLTCAIDVTIECDESTLPDNTGISSATDNCDPDVIPVYADVTTQGVCPQEYTIFRTWTATDDCGNSSTCLQTITVDDSVPPDLTCAADVTIECDDSTLPDFTGSSTATDNCDMEVIPVYADVTLAGTCPQEYTIERTWTATDDCGNSSTCLQTITVEDITPPDLVCAIDVTIECDESTLPDNTGSSTATDNCDPEVIPVYADVTTAGACPQEYMISRTWTATDDCGNSSTCLQIITIEDTTAPEITCPDDITIECDESTLPEQSAGGTSTYTDETAFLAFTGPLTMESFEANAVGLNQNTIITPGFTIDLLPASPASGIEDNPAFGQFATDGINYVVYQSAANGTATFSFNMNINSFGLNITDWGDFGMGMLTFMNDAGDQFTISVSPQGNGTQQFFGVVNSMMSFNTVILTNTIAGEAYGMDEVYFGNAGSATAMDNCDPAPVVTYADLTIASGVCEQEYTIERTWTATDACGNSSTCLQIITVDDSTPPDLTCAIDVTIECDESTLPDNTGTSTATDNCDPEVIPVYADQITEGACPQEYTILRTWTATDDCGNSSTCLQTITVDDSVAPDLTCAIDVTIECDESTLPDNTGSSTATDNCDTEVIPVYADVTTAGACPQEYTIARTWTATDDCGNSSTCLQTITVEDNTAPLVTCAANITIECDESTLPDITGVTTATDNCDLEVTIDYTDVEFGDEFCPASNTIIRTWTVTDDCGNSTSCVQVIYVDDTTPPVLTCPEDVTLECFQSTSPSNPPTEVTTYSSETDFLGDAGALTLESFENNTVGAPQHVIPTSLFTLTLTPQNVFNGVYNTELGGAHATHGVNYVITQTTGGQAPGTATFDFNMPVNAFGMNITDWGDFGVGTLTFSNDAGDIFVVSVSPQGNGNEQFFGIINPGIDFNQVVFTQSISGEGYGIDEIYFGMTSVPGTATATDNCDSLPFINYSDVVIPGECAEEFVVQRTWTATDDCQNSSTCLQIISVEDNLAPTITNCPSDVTIECDESTSTDSLGVATATDFCDEEVEVSQTDVTIEGPCPQSYTIERTWTATDNCGNESTCLQVITVEDTTAPLITCADSITIECDASTLPANTGTSTATDNCDPAPLVTYSDNIFGSKNCPQEYFIFRTWIATDACGNSAQCDQFIRVEDSTPPILTCAADVTIECTESTSPDVTGISTATDNCDTLVIPDYSDVTIAGECPQEYTIIRTWTVYDDCGNSSTCDQSIFVDDSTPPIIVCPGDVSFECADDVPQPNVEDITTSDNCGIPVVEHVSDVTVNQTCLNQFTLERTYRATDECGNSSTCVQTITVDDDTAPVITCPEDVSFECADLVPEPNIEDVTVSDNCTGEPVVEHVSDVTVSQTCVNQYTLNRTYRATDDCGNSATCVQVISVFDDTPPSITCPAAVTVQCAANVPPPSTASVIASDNCNGVPVVTHVSDVTVNQTCVNRYTLNRTYRATDECNNSSTCVQVITVFDSTPPAITCPANITVTCATQVPAPSTASVVASDNCTGPAPTVTHVSDVTVNQTCVNRFTLNRTYRATDACGNSATCIQVITVFDNVPPSITCPANITVTCASQVPAPNIAGVTTSDNCSGPAPVVTHVSDVTVNQTCVNRFTLNRTYRSTDACGNSATCIQVITVFDNVPPSITCPANITVQCAVEVPAPNPASVTTSDNCSGPPPVVTHVSDVTVNQTCLNRYTLNRTYRSTDACGNSATCVQVITVFDNTPPVIDPIDPLLEGVPNNGTIEVQCYGQDPEWEPPVFNQNSVQATDNCTGPITILYDETLIDEGDCDVDGYINRYRMRWTAIDACGNSSVLTIFLNLVDHIPPVILGVPEDVTVNCDEVPDMPTLMAVDECLCACVMELEQEGPRPGCQNGQVIVRRWKATDDCGNMTIEEQRITLIDEEGPVLELVHPEIAGLPDGTILEYTCNEGGIPEFFDDLNAEDIYSPAVCDGFPNIDFDGEIHVATRNCKFFGYIEQREYVWTGTDDCGNQTTHTLIVRLVDNEPPVIVGAPEMACLGDPALEEVMATDNCGDIGLIFWDVPIESPCGSGEAFRRTWEAVDPCGNYQRDTTILIHDVTPPELYFTNPDLIGLGQGEFITTQCDDSEGYYTDWGLNDVFAEDECTDVSVEFEQIIMEQYDCSDGTVVWLNLVWTATDLCGNSSTLILYVYVEDHEAPTLVDFDPEVTIGCREELPTVEAEDNCSEATITYADEIIPGDCEFMYDVIRTITVTDACGNAATYVQTIHVGDDSGPIISGVIEELCDDLSIPDVTAWDPCAQEEVPVMMTEEELDSPCQDGKVIRRTWTAKDVCGNVSTVIQTIYVNDHTPPVIQIPTWSIILHFLDQEPNLVYLSQKSIIDRLNALNESSVWVVDDCDELIIPVFTLDITYSDNCDEDGWWERRVYTWTATDPCGNSSSISFSVDIMDDIPPVIDGSFEDLTIICDQLPPPGPVTASDYSSPVVIVYEQEIGPDNGQGHFVVKRTWTATDPCGNVTVASQTILWIPDTFVECDIILPDAVECNSHGVGIGSDVEGGIGPFTYEWEIVGEKCFIQSGQGTSEIDIYIGFGEVDIFLTVTDAYGCTGVCQATLDCIDPFDNALNGTPGTVTPQGPDGLIPGLPSGGDYLKGLSFWPNPANATVNVRFESQKESEVEISFTNFLGQKVVTSKIDAFKGINSRRIDVSTIHDGTYLLQVKTEKEVHTRTIVIMHNR